MMIAIPLADGRLALHFGHCREFALLEADPDTRTVRPPRTVAPPAHAPGVLPAWLAQQGVTVVIAGGMGQRAQMLFAEHGVEVVIGAPAAAPQELAGAYLSGQLVTGENVCDH